MELPVAAGPKVRRIERILALSRSLVGPIPIVGPALQELLTALVPDHRLDSFALRLRQVERQRKVPVAWYRIRRSRVQVQYVAREAVICDGCTDMVLADPVTEVTLIGNDQYPSTTEALCSECSAARGIHVSRFTGLH